jgi:hypothetical protein
VKFIASMCRAYRLIVAPVVTPALIAALRAELDTLHELAGKMPPTIWRQPLHYMTHFPEQMLLFGPTGDHNMWAYESMFGDLKRLLKSRRHPIASILKACGVSGSPSGRSPHACITRSTFYGLPTLRVSHPTTALVRTKTSH